MFTREILTVNFAIVSVISLAAAIGGVLTGLSVSNQGFTITSPINNLNYGIIMDGKNRCKI